MTDIQSSTSERQPKRRWLRFRLRTLFGVVTVLALLMGWIAWERRQSHHERQIAEQLQKQGMTVTLGGPYDSVRLLSRKQQPRGWWRTLARQVLGERILSIAIKSPYFKDLTPLAGLRNLQWLFLESTQVRDLTPLAELKNLQWLFLSSTQVRDLTPLAGLKNLQWLFLGATQVSDLAPLARLKKLQGLRLESTQVSDLTPLAGLKNLTGLSLGSTPVSDLTPLAGLKNLGKLNLRDTQVSDEQVKSLKQTLPNCAIVR